MRDGAGAGAFEVQLARPGVRTRRLLKLALGDTHSGDVALSPARAAGAWTSSATLDGKSRTFKFTLPSGKAIS